MRILASILACASVLALALLLAWPTVSPQPFPLPGWRNAVPGPGLKVLAVAAFGFAVWVIAFWDHARQHPLLFALVATAFFLYSALFVSVAVGMCFAGLGVMVRSKQVN